ncbi:MAG: ATP-binding protein [Pirellulales bacterium]|nr:ATP-binding protein [Pirellulales bacterium]
MDSALSTPSAPVNAMNDEEQIIEFLRTKESGHLHHREGQELEFKEQFNLAGLADYFKDFAAFANNRGGVLIFGVKDKPRVPLGLSDSALEQFEKVDPEKISGYLLEIFSSDIRWEQNTVEAHGKAFGYFRICEATVKPVIARKDEGKDNVIKNGEVYFRYGGRSQKIQFAELQAIINQRIEQTNEHWLDLMKKIAKAGPENAAILDTEKGLLEKGDNKVFVLDEELVEKLKFIRECEFVEEDGATALKLVGDVVPANKVEVVQKIYETRLKQYPYTATQVAEDVARQLPTVGRNAIWEAIRQNGMKDNIEYAIYSFANKKQEDAYKETGNPGSAPSIYNQNAVDFLVNVLRSNPETQE